MPTFIDLFCGCGGFTLGMERAGFRCLAAVDSNTEAMVVFRANFPHVLHALEKDVAKFAPQELAKLVGTSGVDVIVGGPPCQGFSTARQVDWANHGSRVKRDKRRYLYREFLRHVGYFRPRVFVIENVLGIQSAAKGAIFTRVQAEARALGYRVHPQVEEAWKLGVPQKRRRQLIIGVRADVSGYFPTQLVAAKRGNVTANNSDDYPTLWDAIGDLPRLTAGTGSDDHEYDLKRRVSFLASRGPRAEHYLTNVLEIDRSSRLTCHHARPHNEQDLRDFARLREGEYSAEAIKRGEAMEFTYNRNIFKDRFKRQHREHLCSTIVAHISKDGLMFIHPTQNRSLTVREAARVQSFPDWFAFPVPRTHQFRLVGNAVPPLVAEAIGSTVKHFLVGSTSCSVKTGKIPVRKKYVNVKTNGASSSTLRAARDLERIAGLDRGTLRALPREEFLRGWRALLFLFPDLHPGNALDHGQTVEQVNVDQLPLPGFSELISLRYSRSGWPVALELLGREAWRRYESDEILATDLYYVPAQKRGLRSVQNVSVPVHASGAVPSSARRKANVR